MRFLWRARPPVGPEVALECLEFSLWSMGEWSPIPPIPPTMPHWRLLTTPPATGAENMALDEALMDFARDRGEWVLRVYGWFRPTISLGRNQSARGRYDLREI